MNPAVLTIINILVQYVVNKGGELAEKIGPKAVKVAKQLFTVVLDRLSKDAVDAGIFKRFQERPESHKEAIKEILEREIQQDNDFKIQLEQLLSQYQSVTYQSQSSGTSITQTAGDKAVQIGQARDVTMHRPEDHSSNT